MENSEKYERGGRKRFRPYKVYTFFFSIRRQIYLAVSIRV